MFTREAQVAPPGSASEAASLAAVSRAYEGAITAVSRAANTVEMWYVGADNSVRDHHYFDASGWNGFTLAPARSALYAITAVAPTAGAMNVTWSGFNSGSVENAAFGPWTLGSIVPAGPVSNGGIAAMSQSTGVNVFWVTGNGAIDDASQ